jgi:hypothetical protein
MINRQQIQQQFVIKTVNDLSEEDKNSFILNVLMDSYTANYDDEQFRSEVEQYFPELLESPDQTIERIVDGLSQEDIQAQLTSDW